MVLFAITVSLVSVVLPNLTQKRITQIAVRGSSSVVLRKVSVRGVYFTVIFVFVTVWDGSDEVRVSGVSVCSCSGDSVYSVSFSGVPF